MDAANGRLTIQRKMNRNYSKPVINLYTCPHTRRLVGARSPRPLEQECANIFRIYYNKGQDTDVFRPFCINSGFKKVLLGWHQDQVPWA